MDGEMEKIEYKGYTIETFQDDFSESPRDWDNLGTLYIQSRHVSGDTSDLSVEQVKQLVKQKNIIALPVIAYVHSGVSLSTNRSYPFNDQWDAMQVGYIYVEKDKACKELGLDPKDPDSITKIHNALNNEIKTYNQYLSGEVYGYSIIKRTACSCCKQTITEVKDSCCGYYDYKEMIAEAKSIIEAYKD